MSNYQRFQILSAARQELFCPDSPVWVSRYQLSRDLESGKRLLQVRMVNCWEKPIRQVFLRVVCLGAKRERLTQLELLPLPSVTAQPGQIFGEDKPVELSVQGTVFVELFAQRVRFADGSAWDEAEPEGYLAFHAQTVRREDPHFETLADRARSGGVRNDCYFRAQQGLWVCTCGLPNALRSRRCPRCGADRLWLEKHMDPNLLDAPEPPKAPEPAPAPPVYPTPAPSVTVVPAPFREEPTPAPTIIVQTPPEPEPQEAPVSHAGRNAAIAAAALLFLALGAFCSYRYLMPYLRYRQALQARAAGDYDQAVSLLEELGDYRDSRDQISETLARRAADLMGQEKYQEAMELYETLEGYEDRVADCLYAMGVLAYNRQDPASAMDYVRQLQERFPDYDKTETLAQYCCYSLGNQLAQQAAEQDDLQAYEQAREYFSQAGDYEDSAQRIQECDYRIALCELNQGEVIEGVKHLQALGDYKDAQQRRMEAMMGYLTQHTEEYSYSAFLPSWLQELVEAQYPGAAELLQRLSGEGFQFKFQYSGQADTTAMPESVTDLARVFLRFQVDATDDGSPVLVLVRYVLPDGREGRGLLNPNREATGSRGWAQFPFPTDCTKDGTVTLTLYDAELGENTAPLASLQFSFHFAPEKNSAPTGESQPSQRPVPGSAPGTSGG